MIFLADIADIRVERGESEKIAGEHNIVRNTAVSDDGFSRSENRAVFISGMFLRKIYENLIHRFSS